MTVHAVRVKRNGRESARHYGAERAPFDSRQLGLCHPGVWKNTPPEKTKYGKISFQSVKSVAGEQFLPLACRANARPKGVFFQQQKLLSSPRCCVVQANCPRVFFSAGVILFTDASFIRSWPLWRRLYELFMISIVWYYYYSYDVYY